MKRENIVIGALLVLVVLLILGAATFQVALMTGRPDTVFNFPAQAALLLATDEPVQSAQPAPESQTAVVVVSTPEPTTPTATTIPLPTVPIATSTGVPNNAPLAVPTVEPTLEPDTASATESTAAIQPESVAIEFQAEVVLHNVDDGLLAGIVQNNPFAIGFMNNASYVQRQDSLRVIKLQTDDGRFVEPDLANLTDRTYPLARPLFVYAAEETLRQKPEVARFIGCYLNLVAAEVGQVGYFPINSQAFAQGIINFQAVSSAGDSEQLLNCAPADAPANNIVVSGSSAIAALNQHMANLFVQGGFAGNVYVNPNDTDAGFRQYCEEGTGGDIVGAGRLISNEEMANCGLLNRNPIMFPVAMDALSIVVSEQNTFVQQLTGEQLRTLFTDAVLWSDVDPSWPAEPVIRAVPSTNSDSFDFFAKNIFGDTPIKLATTTNTGTSTASASTPSLTSETVVTNTTPTASTVISQTADAISPVSATTSAGTVAIADTPAVPTVDYVFATVADQPECVLATEVVATVMRDWGWGIEQQTVASTAELFTALSQEETAGTLSANITLCYIDPTDREFFRNVTNIPQLIGRGYAEVDSRKLYAMARPGVPNEMELTDRCIWNFVRGLSFADTLQAGQSPADWLTRNAALLDSWGSCQGQYRVGVLGQ